MPLLMRYPRLFKAGTVRDELALNIDVAPTLLQLAGVSRTVATDGLSLVPLFTGMAGKWRGSFLIEYYSDKVFPRMNKMGYKAVRTERWKYIHYVELNGMDELYDLKADPYEMRNIINRPDAAPALAELKRELERLLK
jgi:N-acetylglucosamine-6-sulfatase